MFARFRPFPAHTHRLVVACALSIVMLSTAACPECRYYNDCDDGQACVDGACEVIEGFGCEPTGESPYFRDKGMLENATHWNCNLPAVANDLSPSFASYDGPFTLVSGGSGRFTLYLAGATDLTGRTVYVGVRGEKTYHEIVSPPVTEGRVEMELFIQPNTPSGTVLVSVHIDDGLGSPGEPSLGPELQIPLNIIGVSSGDIQVSITWDTYTDVDLYVRDPSGAVIYYAQKTSPTGGALDLDSNAACNPPFRQNENIFWPTLSAPSGRYDVWVNLWSACSVTGATNWRITRVLRNEEAEVKEGVVLDVSENPTFDPDTSGRPPDLSFDF